MNILRERPNIADKIQKIFGVNYDDGSLIITCDGNIYTKGGELSMDLQIHEQTHLLQQEKDPEWWNKYFVNPVFRLNQEVEAYRNQYRFIKEHIKNREVVFKMFNKICNDLSGPIYGNIISKFDAGELIKSNDK